MQATVHGKRFGVDRLKLVLVAAGVLATAIAGMAAVHLTTDTVDDSVARSSAGAYAPQPAWRFAEVNQLPEAATVATSHARILFLEANMLPEASSAASASRDDNRFLEINQLPGDGHSLVPPAMTNGTPS